MMLVLASNSPRRRHLLSLSGWEFSVLPVQVDERVLPAERPQDYVLRLARENALAAKRSLERSQPPDTLIIAADTAVVDEINVVEGENVANPGNFPTPGSGFRFDILGKPTDEEDAQSMLSQLRGRTHKVYSALAVLWVQDDSMLDELIVTEVPMRNYSDEEIMVYIASGDPFDKAGGYAIQNAEFAPVQNLQGCYANVMGLPLCHLSRLIATFDMNPGTDIAAACQMSLDYSCPIFRQVLGEQQFFEK
jgi:septum formation protein